MSRLKGMLNDPLVSVVMPVFNERQTIDEIVGFTHYLGNVFLTFVATAAATRKGRRSPGGTASSRSGSF